MSNELISEQYFPVSIDILDGGNGNDILIGGDGSDSLFGGDDEDLLIGGDGDEEFLDGAGDDLNIGGAGNDGFSSGAGNDTLLGGAGDDRFSGGAGNDSLLGGTGADQFNFNPEQGIDNIADFQPGTDKIALFQGFTVLTRTEPGETIDPDEFATVANDMDAATSNAFITYSTGTGNLFYNENGAAPGFGTGDQFATLEGIPILNNEDIIVF